MRPDERLAIDVLLQQFFAHHQPEVTPGAAPRIVPRLVDDVPQIVQPTGTSRFAIVDPFLPRLPAAPCARREAEDLHGHRASFQRAPEDIGAHCGDGDRTAAHGTGTVDQHGDDRVAKVGLFLLLVGEWIHGIDNDLGQSRGVENALVQVERPRAHLFGEQSALQPVGESRRGVLQRHKLLIQQRAQAGEFLQLAKILRQNYFVEFRGVGLVVDIDADTSQLVEPDLGRFLVLGIGGEFAHVHVRVQFDDSGFAVVVFIAECVVFEHDIFHGRIGIRLRQILNGFRIPLVVGEVLVFELCDQAQVLEERTACVGVLRLVV